LVKKISKYAITEIITTGLNFREDKIIHIATYLLTAGKVTNSFVSFINPERSLEPEWSRSVGLSSFELKSAPKFFEIGKDLLSLWENHILLSTNPRYTYTFIKNEFKNLGFAFNHSYAHIDIVIGKNGLRFDPGLNKASEVADCVINKMAGNGETNKTVKKKPKPQILRYKGNIYYAPILRSLSPEKPGG
jgi:DNA polymerase III epsilon subunit-like protein